MTDYLTEIVYPLIGAGVIGFLGWYFLLRRSKQVNEL